MALEDFVDPEVGIAVAATAVVLSPQVRNTLRRGAVFGLAGILRMGDAVSGAVRTVATQAQDAASATVDAAQDTAAEATTTARGRRSTTPSPTA